MYQEKDTMGSVAWPYKKGKHACNVPIPRLCDVNVIIIIALLQLLGDSAKEYERYIFEFSIKNQLRYRGSLGMY